MKIFQLHVEFGIFLATCWAWCS